MSTRKPAVSVQTHKGLVEARLVRRDNLRRFVYRLTLDGERVGSITRTSPGRYATFMLYAPEEFRYNADYIGTLERCAVEVALASVSWRDGSHKLSE